MRKIILILGILIGGICLQAEDEAIKLYLGQPKTISVNTPTRIVIANPEIVDVGEVTKSEITLIPKKSGRTTLIFWDNFGEQALKIRVLSEDLEEIKARTEKVIESLGIKEISAQISEEEDKIILSGEIRSEAEKQRLFTVLGPLKDKIVDLLKIKEEVIEIEVQVLELSSDATKTLGFTWPGTVTLTDVSGPIDTATTGLKNIFHVSDFTRSAFSVALDALVQEGKARILSRPRLSCLSGKEAELLVGGEKPIMTTETVTGGGTSTNVEYKEYGIKLKIRPTAVEEEKIRLAVNIEVSEVGSAETLGTPQAPTARAYPLIKRSASTELLLNDGQTMAIGGLIKQKREEDIRKTPFLGDFPLVGALFRKKETKLGGGFGERGQTELFIALTPKIVTPRIEKEEVSKRIYVEPKVQINIPLNPISEYKWIIQNRIQENLIYPSLAKEAGWQGRVLLALKFSYQGTLLEAEIKSSSGYSILDQNALETAKKIKNFPPFPPAIKEEELYLEIPIVYKLE